MTIPVQLDIEGPAFEKPMPGDVVWPFGDLERGKYACVCADPPWRFETWSEKGRDRSPDYKLMSLADIKRLPVAQLAAKDCLLFLWAVSPMLPQALSVMEAWQFEFKTVGFYWAKTTKRSTFWLPKYHMGNGYWTRANAEVCLLGVRGKPQRKDKGVRQLIVSPVREHSRKPDEFFTSVERLVDGPYCELFSRTDRPNWSAWGDEVGKFNETAKELAP